MAEETDNTNKILSKNILNNNLIELNKTFSHDNCHKLLDITSRFEVNTRVYLVKNKKENFPENILPINNDFPELSIENNLMAQTKIINLQSKVNNSNDQEVDSASSNNILIIGNLNNSKKADLHNKVNNLIILNDSYPLIPVSDIDSLNPNNSMKNIVSQDKVIDNNFIQLDQDGKELINKIHSNIQEKDDSYNMPILKKLGSRINRTNTLRSFNKPRRRRIQYSRKRKESNLFDLNTDLINYSPITCFYLDKNNIIRKYIFSIVKSKWYVRIIMCLILINSILMSVGLSLDIYDTNWIFVTSEYFFTLFFFLEMIMKMIAYGIFKGKKAYFSDKTNFFECSIVISSVIGLIPGFKNYIFLSTFRLFRPLKSLTFLTNIKLMIDMLMQSLKNLFYVILFLSFFMFFFALIGLSLWSDIFSNRCRETYLPNLGSFQPLDSSLCGGIRSCPKGQYCVSYEKVVSKGTHFLSPILGTLDEKKIIQLNYGLTNFDNIGNALFTVHQLSYIEGWSVIMYLIQNASDFYAPAVFFISAIIILNYFVLNFTIGIMMYSHRESLDNVLKKLHYRINRTMNTVRFIQKNNNVNFFNLKEMLERNKGELGTKKVFSWFNLFERIKSISWFKNIYSSKEYHKNKLTFFCYRLIEQPIFKYFMDLIVIANTIILGSDYDGINENSSNILDILNYIFISIFSLEIIAKLIGLGIKEFFSKKFNIIELIIIMISIAEALLLKSTSVSSMRILRIVRVFKIFNNSNLGIMFQCIIETLHEMISYILLLFLMIYVYALIGINLFKGTLKFNKNNLYDPNGILPRNNFEDIYRGFMTVFSVLIGDGWNYIMYKCLLSEQSNKTATLIYFISMVFILKTMINLVIAFLVSTFENVRKRFYFHENKKEILMDAKGTLNKVIRNTFYEPEVIKRMRKEMFHEKKLEKNRINVKEKSINKKILIKKNNSYVEENERINKFEESQISMLGSPSKESINDTGCNNENKLLHKMSINPCENIEMKNEYPFIFRRKTNIDHRRSVTFNHDTLKDSEKNFKSEKVILPKKRKPSRKQTNIKKIRIKRNSALKRIEKIDVEEFTESLTSEIDNRKQIVKTDPESAIGEYFENIFNNVKRIKKEEDLFKRINFNFIEQIIDHVKHSSLGIFHIKSSFRRKVITIVDSKCFEFIMMVLIFLSCINIILQNPFLDTNSTYYNILESLDECFTFMFFIEMVLKVIAYGFIFDNIKKYEMKLETTGEIVNYYVEDDFEIEDMKKHLDKLESQYKNTENRTLKKLDEEHVQSIPKIKKEISSQTSQRNNLKLNMTHGISEDNINYKNNNYSKDNVKLVSSKSYRKNNLSLKDITRRTKKDQDLITTNKKTLEFKTVLNAPEFFRMRNQNSLKKQFKLVDVVDEYLKNVKIDKPVIEKEIFIMKKAYLKDIWNVMDLIILICSLVYLFGSKKTTIKTLKTIRAIRALIPLRVINRFEKVRTLVKCVLQSIPAIGNLILISFIFLFIYAVIGVNLYKGLIGTCSNPSFNNSFECRNKGFIWSSNLKYNFDNVFNSLMIIFQLTLAQGWQEIMFSTVDATSEFSTFYFLIFMILGCIFLINLSVSVIVNNFIMLTEKEDGIEILSPEQREWLKLLKNFLNIKPTPQILKKNVSKLRWLCVIICDIYPYNIIFNNIVYSFIFANAVIMGMKNLINSEDYDVLQYYFYNISTIVFNLEILIKIVAKKKNFFLDNWNKFDLVILIVTDIFMILSFFFIVYYKDVNLKTIPAIIRVLRIMRVINLIKKSYHLKSYLEAIILLIPSLANIITLILLLLTIYACLGMNLFGYVRFNDVITINSNFRSFSESLLLLLRCMTGESWNEVMFNLTLTSNCNDEQTYEDMTAKGINGCGSLFAIPYFISFMVLASIIIINLFVAVVVDTFIAISEKELLVTEDEIHSFFKIWGKYDLEGKYFIQPHELVLLMKELKSPMGFYDPDNTSNTQKAYSIRSLKLSHNDRFVTDNKDTIHILNELNIIARGKNIHILDVILLVIKRIVCDKMEVNEKRLKIVNSKTNQNIKDRLIEYDSKYGLYQNGSKETQFSAALTFAHKMIMEYIYKWKHIKDNNKVENKMSILKMNNYLY